MAASLLRANGSVMQSSRELEAHIVLSFCRFCFCSKLLLFLRLVLQCKESFVTERAG